MAGTIYVALSGMKTRMAHLDRVAADIANEGTAGYKGERAGNLAVDRPSFDAVLDSAVDTVSGAPEVDFRAGVILPTGRDLDVALEGKGFFVVQTPAGPRYTRNGGFTRSADGTLVTLDNLPVLGQNGPIKVGDGTVTVTTDGTLSVNRAAVGRMQVVDFADYTNLTREDGGRFKAPADATPVPQPGIKVRSGALEQSNVSVTQRMASLIEVSRSFEALQRGISLMSNDIDARAISELGRR
jgi:flagellar basal-body rod protein FlgF